MKVALHNEPYPVPQHAASQPLCSGTMVQESRICNTAKLKSVTTKLLFFKFYYFVIYCGMWFFLGGGGFQL